MNKMGLEEEKDFVPVYIKGEKHYMPAIRDSERWTKGPKVAAVILAEKAAAARARGNDSVEHAIKRYNGKGSAMEEIGYGEFQQADVNQYWKKIQEAKILLGHPKNAALRDYYNSRYEQ
jgi:hypothetical protein